MIKSYVKPDIIVDFERLIDQLNHAVCKFNGKTNLTETDIVVMKRVCRELIRYDQIASR